MVKQKTPPVTSANQGANARKIPARHFFGSAFKDFSLYDNVRSIPRLTDGMKPSQRKAIYGTQLRGENAGLQTVERLSAAVAASTDYHHGIGSMQTTIVGLANTYPGSNNINFFVPEGQFGSRLTSESAAARYIETKLSPHFRNLCPKADDSILEHHVTDGEKIEPKTYAPLLPMVLVNGASGTGTGHASVIMAYNPKEIIANCLVVLSGKNLVPGTLVPWYNGFSGEITRTQETGQVVCVGRLEVENATTIRVSELPIGTFLDQYKSRLMKLEDAGFIKDFEDRSTEDGFDFKITAPRSTTALSVDELYKKFGLITRNTENFTVWNIAGTLKRFESAEALIEEFIPWRLSMMEARRQKLMSNTAESIRWMSEKLRFILFYLDNVDKFKNQKKDDLVALLLQNKFVDYDRLLQMTMWNLTRDKIDELRKLIADEEKALALLDGDTAQKMYTRELKALDY